MIINMGKRFDTEVVKFSETAKCLVVNENITN